MITSTSTLVGASNAGSLDREILAARLKSSGLRVTAPRIALLDALVRINQPTTIDQLFAKAGNSTCDLVTIYRSMAAFEKAGVVYRSGFSERGAVLYSTAAGGIRRYPVIRRGSAIIDELDTESSAELHATIDKIKQRLQARGYQSLQHIVEFFAVPAP